MARFVLGGREFARKTDARDYVRAVLNDTPIGGATDDQLVRALLDLHPQREEKAGRGVAAIEVHKNDWGNRAFAVRTDDGDLIVFSYLECFKPSTPEQDAKAALRVEIAEQITAFRQVTPLVCEVTGLVLTNAPGQVNTAEVDHVPPRTFNSLAKSWTASEGGWSSVKSHQEGQRRLLTLADQRQRWQDFHARYAILRMLSARAHRNVGGAV